MAKAPNDFIPGLWSDEILKTFKSSGTFANDPLEPYDLWKGQTYQECCAFAYICEVTVLKSRFTEEFILLGRNRMHKQIPVCSPEELLNAIKQYAGAMPGAS